MEKLFNSYLEKLINIDKRNPLVFYKEKKNYTLRIKEKTPVDVINTLNEYDKVALKEENDSSKKKFFVEADGDVLKIKKSLRKKYLEFLDEQGVNTLFVASFFLKFKFDNEDYFSPILLTAITIDYNYNVSSIDDELIINPALRYMLKVNYKLELDEEISIDNLDYLLKQIVDVTSGILTNESYIDIFSFYKLKMYQDLTDNKTKMLNHIHIRRLLGDNIETNPSIINKKTDLLVVDADSSQMQAVQMALEGKSFVLEGPPGTGKSQTITNIIAKCLENNKKVLFVAAKQAALNVVYNNLKKVSLDAFALPLYSINVRKKDVIDALYETLNTRDIEINKSYHDILEKREKSVLVLTHYQMLLSSNENQFNESVISLVEKVISLNKYNYFDYALDVSNFSTELFDEQYEIVRKFTRLKGYLYDYQKDLYYGYNFSDQSKEYKNNLVISTSVLISLFERFLILIETSKKEYSIAINTFNELMTLVHFVSLILKVQDYYDDMFDLNKLPKIIDDLTKLIESSDICIRKKQIINQFFNDNFFNLNGKEALSLIQDNKKKFFRFVNKRYCNLKKQLKACKVCKLKKDSIELALSNLIVYEEEFGKFEKNSSYIKSILKNNFKSIFTDFRKLKHICLGLMDIFSKNKHINFEHLSKEMFAKILLQGDKYKKYIEEIVKKDQKHFDYLDQVFDDGFNYKDLPFKDALNRFKEIKEKIVLQPTSISNYKTTFNRVCKAQEKGVIEFIDLAINTLVPQEDVENAFLHIYYKSMLNYLINSNQELSDFNYEDINIEKFDFTENDKLSHSVLQRIIHHMLIVKKPTDNIKSSAFDILNSEHEKKRNILPIRKLFERIPDLALDIKPCFLMSPLSVSTYIDAEKMVFDTLIFDEASQILVEDALGSIFRSKQFIVVGDSKQMPPTSFFQKEVYDDSSESSDFESILNVTKARYPSTMLKWHYRSKVESLISFSNKAFYGSNLITFADCYDDSSITGPTFYYVENGRYENRVNINEAKKVASLVFETMKNYPTYSLGVVAFSVSQEEEIERQIDILLDENPEFQQIYNSFQNAEFFVKNLETIQGDERDIIIISVGYAKDASGKFSHNFGPINREGGERRLNVLITRAKYNIKLVSSIRATDITNTNSLGSELLKKYLDYVEHCKQNQLDQNCRPALSITEEIGEFLTKSGLDISYEYGKSNKKINIIVNKPYNIAIEIDDSSYYQMEETRDRIRIRKETLEHLGWKYIFIYSLIWYKDKERVKEELLNKIYSDVVEVEYKELDDAKYIVQEEEKYLEYIEFNIGRLSYSNITYENFTKLINQIIHLESPIEVDYLLRKTNPVYRFEHITISQKNHLAQFMENSLFYYLRDGFIYKKGQKETPLRIPSKEQLENNTYRKIREISIEELSCGLKSLIQQNKVLSKLPLYKKLIEKLGFNRLSKELIDYLDLALELIKNISINGDIIKYEE